MANFEDHNVEVWRYDGDMALFNWSLLVPGWLPNPGPWVDVTNQVQRTMQWTHTRSVVSGPKLDITIFNESRIAWLEGKPVVLVAQHWADGVLGAREVVMWGYLQGEGEQEFDYKTGVQRGKRSVGVAVEWTNIPIPALTFGRPNLMAGATFDASKSVAILPSNQLSQEAHYGEFISQSTADGSMGIDGNPDTVVVSNLLAQLEPNAVLGDTVQLIGGEWLPVPRILRAYFDQPWGTDTGEGGTCGFIELACHAHHITWGNMENPAAVPAFYETDVGSPYPAVINNAFIDTDFEAGQGRNGGQALYVRFKNQSASAHPENGPYIQWNTSSNWRNYPAKLTFWVKARFAGSVGKSLWVQLKPAAPDENTTQEVHLILTDQYVKYTLNIDSLGRYGGVMMRFRSEINGVASQDMIWLLDDLTITVGYSDQLHSDHTGSRFTIAWDNGHGTEGRHVLYFDRMADAGWSIPPEGTIIVANDANALRARFNPGDIQVITMRNKAPLWWFGPLTGARLKTQFGNNPSRVDYDNDAGTNNTIEELLFSGLNWDAYGGNPSAIRRNSPVSTGAFVQEDYPRFGVNTQSSGPSYFTYDLGEFIPPTLGVTLTQTGLLAQTTNGDYYGQVGVMQIDDEMISYVANDDGALTLSQRGFNPFGAPFGFGHPNGPIAHNNGARVYPVLNNVKQTGHRVADVSIFRRAGTAKIRDGKVLYSNAANPGSPSPNFERTVGGDWKVFSFFSNGSSESVTVTSPEPKFVQARWLSVIIANMEPHPVYGDPQRGKFNEVTARPYFPGASGEGNYRGRQVSRLHEAVGHLMVVWGGVPLTKFTVDPSVQNVPMDFTSIAPNMLTTILEQLLSSASLMIVTDGYGAVRLTPSPESAFFVDPQIANVWGLGSYRANPAARWTKRQQVSQVVAVGREVAAMRTHRVAYPDIAARRGRVLEIKDVTVLGIDQLRDFARAKYRQANAQRTPPTTTGYVPGLAVLQRNLVDLGDLDLGGQMVGVNVYVNGYVVRVTPGAQGSTLWRTDLDQAELMIG